MDFGIRELLMLIGALVFAGVLFDGVRRFQNNRRSQIKVDVDRKTQTKLESEEDDLDLLSVELPNGGARVKNEGETDFGKEKIAPKFTEPEDILMKNADKKSAPEVKELVEEESAEVAIDPPETELPPSAPQNAVQNRDKEQGDLFPETHGSNVESKQKETVATEDDAARPEKTEVGISAKQSESSALPEEILAINVMAKSSEAFDGAQFLEAVNNFGLRFGEMDIFHRHEHSNGQGAVIFSMACAVNPGTFDLETIEESSIQGVTFFMRLSQVSKRLFVLELMLDIAKRLANQLNGELRDDTHSVLSSQTVTHYKSRIQEYERKHLSQALRH